MKKQVIAMFPGTFDPIHKGHLDIISRASKMFDKVYVVVSINIYKNTAETISKRLEKVKAEVKKLKLSNVVVEKNKNLTVTFAKKHSVSIIIRSIRNAKDATYEIDMAKVNHCLNQKIETILMLPRQSLKTLSSTSIRYLKDAKKHK
ncbi:MAG: pantetheine-phosphate adenylyltransferase [Mycoplasmoidaceae bacterium]|nr:pantetheine-phosphate adenylyltransferase [Mycoplasmoidaceae bacterium]